MIAEIDDELEIKLCVLAYIYLGTKVPTYIDV